MTRLEKLLGVVLALILIGGLLGGLWVWQQRQLDSRLQGIDSLELLASSSDRIDLSSLGLSVRSFGMAHAAAAAWHGDAQMITGINSWPELNSAQDLQKTSADGWQYVFYSPAAREAATFGVDDSGDVSQSPSRRVSEPLNPRPPSEWEVRDDEAVQIFLENGGREFMEKEDTVYMTMQISTIAGNNRVEWLIAAVADQTGNSLTMWIDATSGEIIDTIVVE